VFHFRQLAVPTVSTGVSSRIGGEKRGFDMSTSANATHAGNAENAANARIQGSPATGARLWIGRVLTALPILGLTASASMKLSHSDAVVQGFVTKYGFPESTLLPIGILELFCVVMYAVPRTRILGAILVAAYLGGATVTHVRASEPFVIPVLMGIMAWLGVYLTDRRLEALVPLRAPR